MSNQIQKTSDTFKPNYIKPKNNKFKFRKGNKEVNKNEIFTTDKPIPLETVFIVDDVIEKSYNRRLNLSNPYYKVIAPIEYYGLWTKVAYTENKGIIAPKSQYENSKMSEDSQVNILKREIDSGFYESEELVDAIIKWRLSLKNQAIIAKYYSNYNQKILQLTSTIIDKIHTYETADDAIIKLNLENKIKLNLSDQNRIKFAWQIYNTKSMNKGKNKTSTDKQKKMFKEFGESRINKKIDFSKEFNEKIKEFKKIIENFTNMIKNKSSSSKLFEALIEFMKYFVRKIDIFGVESLIKDIKNVLDAHKLREIFLKNKIAKIEEEVEYGLKKITRAFNTKVSKLVNSLVNFTSTIITIFSAGFAIALSSVLIGLATINAVIEQSYRSSKGLYKWIIHTRGVNRTKYAKNIVEEAINNREIMLFLQEIIPQEPNKEYFNRDLLKNNQEIRQKLVKDVAFKMKSQ